MDKPNITELTVLFDANCAICRRARSWFAGQPTFIPVKFLPLQTDSLELRFPGIREIDLHEELTVIGPQMEYWQGYDAWLMALWSLQAWREWAIELAQPMWKPLARRLILELSDNRHRLSEWLTEGRQEELMIELRQPDAFPDGACHPQTLTRKYDAQNI